MPSTLSVLEKLRRTSESEALLAHIVSRPAAPAPTECMLAAPVSESRLDALQDSVQALSAQVSSLVDSFNVQKPRVRCSQRVSGPVQLTRSTAAREEWASKHMKADNAGRARAQLPLGRAFIPISGTSGIGFGGAGGILPAATEAQLVDSLASRFVVPYASPGMGGMSAARQSRDAAVC